MSKYKVYAKMLNDLAKKRISDYTKAKELYGKAKSEYENIPLKMRIDAIKDADYILERKKKEVAYIEAENNFKEAQNVYKNTLAEAEELRSALYNDIEEDLSINPKDLDKKTVDLLTSGVCTAREVADLFEKADTITTKRYISQFAHDKIAKDPGIDGYSILSEVSYAGNLLIDPNNSEAMQRFDNALDVLNRCVKNPGMVDYWEQLTEEPFSNM